MVHDSDSDSLQKLTECLCVTDGDGQKLPLLHDPVLEEVNLCYKAIPHHKYFLTKREREIKKRTKEGEEAAEAEKKALAFALEIADKEADDDVDNPETATQREHIPVSYTHLTLPTIYSV